MFTSTQQMGSTSKQMSEDSWMLDLDPMIEGGFKVLYYKPFPVQIRYLDKQQKQIARRDVLLMRVLVLQTPQSYSNIKLEITSDENLFMSYLCKIDEKKFQRIRKGQSLNFGYNSLLNMLLKQLHMCEKNPEQYASVLNINNLGSHRLDFTENMQYKSIELLSLDFESFDEELSQQCISYRFSNLKAKNQRIQIKTRQMCNMIKLKNPNLLQIIAKKTSNNMMLQQVLGNK